jgi:Aminoglycoside-2''-adenylyltransferase
MRATPASWKPILPAHAASLFHGLSAPWWIAGGWALDLHLGGQSRTHKDLDVGILRRDAVQILAHLPSYEFHEVKDGVLTWLHPGKPPALTVHSLWCRRAGTSDWMMQLLLDEAEGDSWVFRRDRTVSRPLREVICRNSHGIPYLAPEVQLLYKARAPRPEDEADFALVAPFLGIAAREWLRGRLQDIAPQHAWLARL